MPKILAVSLRVLLFLGAILFLRSIGCALLFSHEKPEVHIPRECIVSVELTDKTECHSKQGETVLHCTGLKLVKYEKCEILKVNQKEKR